MISGNDSCELSYLPPDMNEQVDGHPKEEDGSISVPKDKNKPLYRVTDVPPWYLCIFFAFQHYLTAFGGMIVTPVILAEGLCLQHDSLTQSHLINTVFLVSGLSTVLQVTFGVRLPIIQGSSFALLLPALAFLSTPEWKCPDWTHNASLVNTSSPLFIEVWQTRLRTLQGSIMLASILQILVGFSGLIGFLMRFIGPLTIAPTVCLIGLSLYDTAGHKAGSHWGISAMTTALIILFSQYLRFIPVPLPTCSTNKRLRTSRFYVFQSMPILLGILISWLVCYILTISDILPSNPAQYGYLARTDVKGNVMNGTSWFTVPYPGQWGMPIVNVASVLGIISGIICSMTESVGDYYSCAKLAGAAPPPNHAINRGIGIEGLCSLLAGAFGTGNGMTSFSENVAALGMTKVCSRGVILLSGIFLILTGILGKIGVIFTTMPAPVLGGMFLIMFGIIAATGISTLQSTDMNSSRTIFIFGFSIFSALSIPNWIIKNPDFIKTGVTMLDRVLSILLATPMFVGGFLGFFLDNTIPGTRHERGLLAWESKHPEDLKDTLEDEDLYDLPFGITSILSSQSWVRYIPFLPRKKNTALFKSEDRDLSQSHVTEPLGKETGVMDKFTLYGLN
ncbi:solute carrier family 23 member 1-like [Antennarius striatus]|uniref:solute carrier family 23 member 1-like n=1 Tax=Antennarius striatus TaxID=241820 RepID=UPI0035B4F60E